MSKTFRDYIKDSKIELPQAAYEPSVTNKKYEEVSEPSQQPTYTSETPKTDAKNIDYTNLYISDDNVKKVNQSTPIIGNIASAIESVKDRWNQEKHNWKEIIKGLGDIESNPNMAYYLSNALLRYINGPEKVLPYNNDLNTSNLAVKIAETLGLGDLLSELGIGSIGGQPITIRDYKTFGNLKVEKNSEHNTKTSKDYTTYGGTLGTDYGVSNDIKISSIGEKGQEKVSSSNSERTIFDEKDGKRGTRMFTTPLYNIPLFSIKGDGQFNSIFLTEDYLGKKNLEIASESFKNSIGPNWETIDNRELTDPAKIKQYINYALNTSPYIQDAGDSIGPVGNVKFALENLKALHGYEPFKNFSLRNDNVWSMRLYPYSPDNEYKSTREENKEYYEGTLTPQLPITYIPYWTYAKESNEFSLGIYEFDWEKYTPIQSYDLTIGQLTTDSIELYNGRLLYPEDIDYAMHLRTTILDDVDATFSKYLSYYFNKTIDKDSNSRAPIEYCAFIAELIIFKPALKVNFHFKFIVVPIEYAPSFTGSESDSTSSALIDISFQVIGIKAPSNSYPTNVGNNLLPKDMIYKRWNDVTLTPGTNGNSENRKNQSVSNSD